MPVQPGSGEKGNKIIIFRLDFIIISSCGQRPELPTWTEAGSLYEDRQDWT